MFLKDLFGPKICYGGGGGSSGGGGGGSSSSSSSSSRSASSGGGKGSSSGSSSRSSKPKKTKARPAPKPKGRDRDADMYAGSRYKKQSNGSYKSPSSVTADDLKSGNVSTYKNKNGTGSLTVSRGTKLKDAPTVNVGVDGRKTRKNTDVYDSKDVAAPKTKAPVSTGSSSPVTAPERIDPTDGVGGGRDGGGSARRKASQTSEDNVQVKRAAEGVDKYKKKRAVAAKANPMAIAAKRKA